MSQVMHVALENKRLKLENESLIGTLQIQAGMILQMQKNIEYLQKIVEHGLTTQN